MTNSLQIHGLGPYGPAEREQHMKLLHFSGVSLTTDRAQNCPYDGVRLTLKFAPSRQYWAEFSTVSCFLQLLM